MGREEREKRERAIFKINTSSTAEESVYWLTVLAKTDVTLNNLISEKIDFDKMYSL